MCKFKTVKEPRIRIIIMIFFIHCCMSMQILGQSRLDKIHDNATVVDAHAHNLNFNNNESDNQLNLKMLEKGGVDVVGLYFAYYPIKNSTLLAKVRSDISKLQKQINTGKYHVSIASNSEQIAKFINNGNVAIMTGVEYFYGVFQNDISTLDSLYELGIRAITLMDNEYDLLSIKNQEEQSSVTLSDFGKRIIARMNQLGMLIDISHLNDEMQQIVIEYSDCPVIASHSPVRAVHNVERNIPDEILLQLVEKHGAIMITFNSGALAGLDNGRTNIDKLIDHIMHAIKIVGIDYIGVGSDFNGSGLRSPNGLENASDFHIITYHLAKRGLKSVEIEKILGLNYLNLLKRVEKFAHE